MVKYWFVFPISYHEVPNQLITITNGIWSHDYYKEQQSCPPHQHPSPTFRKYTQTTLQKKAQDMSKLVI